MSSTMEHAARLLQEVIAADDGSSTAGTQGAAATASYGPQYGSHYGSHYGHSYSQYSSAGDYNHAGYSGSGAGPNTMWIMMGVVSCSYMLLFVMMGFTCCYRPHVFLYSQMGDVEVAGGQPKPAGSSLPPHLAGPVAELDKQWRNAFIAKVYGILCVQLAITVFICFSMMQFGGYNLARWVMTDGYWTRMVSLVAMIALICSLMCVKNKHPHNLIVLGAFTVVMSYTIGITCTFYAAAGMGVLVVEAFAITSVLFIGLTLFVMHSKIDFSWLGMLLPSALLILMIWGFFAMFAFDSFAFRQVYALLGCIIFVGYILYDTHQITTYLPYDDYVVGAINLYLDFINLFVFILQLLSGGRRE